MKIPEVFESVLEIFRGDEDPFLQDNENILQGGFEEQQYEDGNRDHLNQQRFTNGSKEESNVMGRNSSHQNFAFVNS